MMKYLDVVLLSLVVSIIILICYHFVLSPTEPKPVEVNLKKIISHFVVQLSKKEISEEEKKRLTEKFTVILERELTQYSQENNVTIFNSGAVVSSSHDITNIIRRRVYEKD